MELEAIPSRKISNSLRYVILSEQKWHCAICGRLLKYSEKHRIRNAVVAHIDHIHPYIARESYFSGIENINERDNLQALCPECNLKKGVKIVRGI